ncbi:MAG: hypothetical protein PF795_03340 [Kiritimatiellae bacterium]|nr:hypothetical protein [Kiritimatiellia bacterium]
MNKFNFQWLLARCIPIFLVLAFASCASLSPREATLRRLEQTHIDEVRFQRADIDDAISFLVQAYRERDTEFTKGVGIIFMDPEGVSEPVPDKSGADPFGFGAPASPPTPSKHSTPPITLELRNVTLKEVLDAVCDVAGVEWRIDENGILLLEPLSSASLTSHARDLRLEVKEFDHHIDWRVGERRMFELTLQVLDVYDEGDAELKMI